MRLPALLFGATFLLIGACGMKGDLYESAPSTSPAAPEAAAGDQPTGEEAGQEEEGPRKTIPRTPAPEQSQ